LSPRDSSAWLAQGIYAHRGWHGAGRTENSPSAFHAAIEAGFGIECDVQQSADAQAMVFHDWELDRLTGETGPVRARTAKELSRIPLNGGDPIWTLAQLLGEIDGRVPLLVELKSRREVPYAPLCLAVAAALGGYEGFVAAMSFDPRIVRWFARHETATVRGLVVSERDSGPLARRWAAFQARPQFLAYDVRDLPSRFAAAQRGRGLPVLTWTVSDKARLDTARAFADAPIAEAEGLEEALRNP
jgi:glycerophosphoryl diester phosphodiesterase